MTAPGTAATLTVDPRAPATTAPPDLWRTIFHIAWLAILLGLAIEALLLLAAAGFGTLGSPHPVVADLLQKVSWSFLLCVGLGLGHAVLRAKPVLVGASGFLAAPLAFAVARALHKSASAGLVVAGAGGPSPLLVAALKGVEYGVFGWLLARLGRRPSPGAHAGAGLAIGVIFGGLLLVVSGLASSAPMSAGTMAARAISEVLFPVGCALVLWTAEELARR